MSKRSTYRTHQKDFEKYFGDALSEKERNALESRALEDGFEAEAMEGWEEVSLEAATEDLAELRHRIHSQERSFNWFKIAAAIALIIVSGILVWNNSKQHSPDVLSQDTKTEGTSSGKSEPLSAVPAPNTTQTKENDVIKEEAEPTQTTSKEPVQGSLMAKNDSEAPDTEMIRNVREESPTIQAIDQASYEDAAEDLVAELQIVEPEEQTPVQVLAVEDQTLKAVRMRPETKASGRVYQELADVPDNDDLWSFRQIYGNVYDENGQIVSDARIVLSGTPILAVSDFNGKFEMAIPDSLVEPTLVFSSVGFDQLRFNIDDTDTFDVVMAREDQSAFIDGLLSGRARNNSTQDISDFYDDPEFVEAQPVGGYRKFEKYLKKSAIALKDDEGRKIKGSVILTLDINAVGKKTISVFQSLGDLSDKEAIRLVEQGPMWTPASLKGVFVSTQVQVEVTFD